MQSFMTIRLMINVLWWGNLKSGKGQRPLPWALDFTEIKKIPLGNILKNMYAKFHDDLTNNECAMVGKLKTGKGATTAIAFARFHRT